LIVLIYPSIVPASSSAKPSRLSLHDALPISGKITVVGRAIYPTKTRIAFGSRGAGNDSKSSFALDRLSTTWNVDTVTPAKLAALDRKSTRLNSSHVAISYAVFCLKKKKQTIY